MRVGGWPSRWEDEACLGGKDQVGGKIFRGMQVGGWPCRWEDEACLGGKEGLDSRWPGHDALTKIERVEASGTRVGPFFRNSDPKKLFLLLFFQPGFLAHINQLMCYQTYLLSSNCALYMQL